MHVERAGIQGLEPSVRLRHLLIHASQDVQRDHIPPPETQSHRAVLLIFSVVYQYAYHIARMEIAQRIFKQLIHTNCEILRGILRRHHRSRRSRYPRQLPRFSVEKPVVAGDLVLYSKV